MTRRGFASSGAAVGAAILLVVVGAMLSQDGRGPSTALAAPDAPANSPRDAASYAIGYDMGLTAVATLRQDAVEYRAEDMEIGRAHV